MCGAGGLSSLQFYIYTQNYCWQGKLVRRIAETFQFSGGEKAVHQSRENKGLSGSWRAAWTWRPQELFVILEDDVEMSVHWYRAAVNMWQVTVSRCLSDS